MKIIVCTGDSHTCGQGADSIKTASKPKNPNRRYDTSGKGIGSTNCDLDTPSYANLLRQYVVEHTNSRYSRQTAQELAEAKGLAMEKPCCVLERELVIDNEWDLITLCVGEQEIPGQLDIFLDGNLYKTEQVHTERVRYEQWSYRYVLIFCSGAKKVRLVPSGKVCIRNIQFAAGEYTVLNTGVGSCTTERYRQACFDYCVAQLQPAIIVAEAQTINDWINYESAREHYDMLKALVEKMQQTGARVLFTTVAPIEGKQENAAGVRYSDFIAASKQLAKDMELPMADAHEAFCQALAPIPKEEQTDYMYVDRWHVCARGHKIYADTIWETLKGWL